jgi:two-component system response regulator AlgR
MARGTGVATEKVLTVIAVDDEPLALRRVAQVLAHIPRIKLIGTYRGGAQGIDAVREKRPDVLLLDVNMAEIDGFDVIAQLGEDAPVVVFVTAFEKFAIRAFDVQATDYILKPLELDRTRAAFDNARQRIQQRVAGDTIAEMRSVVETLRGQEPAPASRRYESEIWVPWAGTFERLKVGSIDWIEAEGDYVLVHALGKAHLIRETMSSMEERLDPETFARVHRSAMVAHGKIVKIEKPAYGRLLLVLDSGAKVPVGRSYLKAVKSWMALPEGMQD